MCPLPLPALSRNRYGLFIYGIWCSIFMDRRVPPLDATIYSLIDNTCRWLIVLKFKKMHRFKSDVNHFFFKIPYFYFILLQGYEYQYINISSFRFTHKNDFFTHWKFFNLTYSLNVKLTWKKKNVDGFNAWNILNLHW